MNHKTFYLIFFSLENNELSEKLVKIFLTDKYNSYNKDSIEFCDKCYKLKLKYKK